MGPMFAEVHVERAAPGRPAGQSQETPAHGDSAFDEMGQATCYSA